MCLMYRLVKIVNNLRLTGDFIVGSIKSSESYSGRARSNDELWQHIEWNKRMRRKTATAARHLMTPAAGSLLLRYARHLWTALAKKTLIYSISPYAMLECSNLWGNYCRLGEYSPFTPINFLFPCHRNAIAGNFIDSKSGNYLVQ